MSRRWRGSNAHVGRHVSVAARRRNSDRWGRVPASVVLADRPAPARSGARSGRSRACRRRRWRGRCLLRARTPRPRERGGEQGLGVWAADGYKPASSADAARLRALAGRFALVEGRIRSIGERQQRTYLNFGSNWANDFTIIIPKRTWATLRDRGLSARFLNGRRVRGRGLIEAWRGPTMEILASDMLEVLDQDRLRR